MALDYERYAATVHQGVRQCASMQGKTRERWQELCEQAAKEQDPSKMLEIVEEINRLLAVKYDRISHSNGAPPKTSKQASHPGTTTPLPSSAMLGGCQRRCPKNGEAIQS